MKLTSQKVPSPKLPSPIVTLLVGVLIAVITVILSVRAHARHTEPSNEYGAPTVTAVAR